MSEKPNLPSPINNADPKLNRGSIVDVEGVVSVPSTAVKGTTQQVEVQVRKLKCVSRAIPTLSINIEDAARSEAEIENAEKNFTTFRQFLVSERFLHIDAPTLMPGSCEGWPAVFKIEYEEGLLACLTQSPQLHKQMAICGGLGRVFVIGPVFRAEDSFTRRHLRQFRGLDVEMEIKERYSEVMDIVDRLFVTIFDSINENCKSELEAIGRQYPFQPLKYLRKTLRLTFEEGIQMLKVYG